MHELDRTNTQLIVQHVERLIPPFFLPTDTQTLSFPPILFTFRDSLALHTPCIPSCTQLLRSPAFGRGNLDSEVNHKSSSTPLYPSSRNSDQLTADHQRVEAMQPPKQTCHPPIKRTQTCTACLLLPARPDSNYQSI